MISLRGRSIATMANTSKVEDHNRIILAIFQFGSVFLYIFAEPFKTGFFIKILMINILSGVFPSRFFRMSEND
jgi:hypothetical protein